MKRHKPPCVNQPWLVPRSPAKIVHPFHIGRLLIKPLHIRPREGFERRSASAAVRQHVEQRQYGRQAGGAEGREEVVGKSGALVWGGNGGDGEDFYAWHLFCEVGGEVAAVESTLVARVRSISFFSQPILLLLTILCPVMY
jgi:hypothetical protein